MFQVKSVVDNSMLKEGKAYDVYSVKMIGLDAIFLIYGEDKRWHWSLADCFVPLEDSYEYGYV